jgi:hypothetical protein
MTMLLGFLALAAASDAQIAWSPPQAIYVNVVNRDLSPVPGATVSLERADGAAAAPVRTATTNVGGHVEFRELPAGSYVVRIVHARTLEMTFGPVPIDDKTPPSVRIPQILAMLNPVLAF